MPLGQKTEQKTEKNIVTNSIMTLKRVHIKKKKKKRKKEKERKKEKSVNAKN